MPGPPGSCLGGTKPQEYRGRRSDASYPYGRVQITAPAGFPAAADRAGDPQRRTAAGQPGQHRRGQRRARSLRFCRASNAGSPGSVSQQDEPRWCSGGRGHGFRSGARPPRLGGGRGSECQREDGRMSIGVVSPGAGPQPPGPSPAAGRPGDDATRLAWIAAQAIIGNRLRVPVACCEAGSCGARHADPAALGEADIRARAIAGGWREDLAGLLTCPGCQLRAPWPDAFQPVTRQRWAAGGQPGGSVSGVPPGAGHPYPAGPERQAAPPPLRQPQEGQRGEGQSPDGHARPGQPPEGNPRDGERWAGPPAAQSPEGRSRHAQPATARRPGPRHQDGPLPDSRPAPR